MKNKKGRNIVLDPMDMIFEPRISFTYKTKEDGEHLKKSTKKLPMEEQEKIVKNFINTWRKKNGLNLK